MKNEQIETYSILQKGHKTKSKQPNGDYLALDLALGPRPENSTRKPRIKKSKNFDISCKTRLNKTTKVVYVEEI